MSRLPLVTFDLRYVEQLIIRPGQRVRYCAQLKALAVLALPWPTVPGACTFPSAATLRMSPSHPFECAVRFGGKAHHDGIPRRDPVQILGRDVLAELTRLDSEALGIKFSEQLGVDEVHLSKVGLGRVCGDA